MKNTREHVIKILRQLKLVKMSTSEMNNTREHVKKLARNGWCHDELAGAMKLPTNEIDAMLESNSVIEKEIVGSNKITEFDEIFKVCPSNCWLLVSQYGRVKNKYTNIILRQKIFNGCLIIEDPSNNRPFEWVHRLVALTWITDVPEYGQIVHHKNDNDFDNRIDNLEWVNIEWVNEDLCKDIYTNR